MAMGAGRLRAAAGGVIGLVEEGDEIAIDVAKRTLELRVSETELTKRRQSWQPLPPKVRTGYLARYAEQVSSAARGAVVEAKPETGS